MPKTHISVKSTVKNEATGTVKTVEGWVPTQKRVELPQQPVELPPAESDDFDDAQRTEVEVL